jgi:hypothetical protein
VACDQFTSQPEYWREVEKEMSQCPSAFHIIFPEVYLEEAGHEERIASINANMEQYVKDGILPS